MFVSRLVYASMVLLNAPVCGFVAPKFGSSGLTKHSPLYSTVNDMGSKFFQLQEMEDQECSTTELFLHDDGNIDLFDTDGPVPTATAGSWQSLEDGQFIMRVKREFEAGKSESDFTDMGEFKFIVDRTFTGAVSKVGELIAVEGVMHDIDEVLGDREVGYFEMLDTTETRLGYEL